MVYYSSDYNQLVYYSSDYSQNYSSDITIIAQIKAQIIAILTAVGHDETPAPWAVVESIATGRANY